VTVLPLTIKAMWSAEERGRQGEFADIGPQFLPLPAHKTAEAAGIDLHAAVDGQVLPRRRLMVPTGLCIELPPGTVGLVAVRSGLSVKYGLRLVNGVGIVDSDFRGELVLCLTTDELLGFRRGDRLCQLVVANYRPLALKLVDELSRTDRGVGGWGSTGGHGG